MFRMIAIATKLHCVAQFKLSSPLEAHSGLCQFDFTLFFITMIVVIKISGLIILWVDGWTTTKRWKKKFPH
jgi:hypothetical protein